MFLKVQSELPYEDFQIEDNLVIVQICFALDIVGCSLVTKSCLTLCDPMDCSPPGSSIHGDSPGKNTRVGCHALLQEIFLTQGLNSCLLQLLHCKWVLYHQRHLGRLRVLYLDIKSKYFIDQKLTMERFLCCNLFQFLDLVE